MKVPKRQSYLYHLYLSTIFTVWEWKYVKLSKVLRVLEEEVYAILNVFFPSIMELILQLLTILVLPKFCQVYPDDGSYIKSDRQPLHQKCSSFLVLGFVTKQGAP